MLSNNINIGIQFVYVAMLNLLLLYANILHRLIRIIRHIGIGKEKAL